MRKTALLALSFVLFASAAGAAMISGKVTAGGQPFPGGVVSIYGIDGVLRGEARADALGRYAISVPAAEVRLLAWDPAGTFATAFHANADSFESSAIVDLRTSATFVIDFALPEAGWIRGVVRSRASGDPLAGAVVTAWNPSGTRRGTATTDANGVWSLAFPGGTYRVAAWDAAGAYVPQFARGKSSYDSADGVRVVSKDVTPLDFALVQKGWIEGSVTAGSSEGAFAAAVVDIYTYEGVWVARATSGEDGRYAIGVAPGRYRVTGHDPAGVYAGTFYSDAEAFSVSAAIDVIEGDVRREVDLHLPLAGRIGGRVTRDDGTPLTGIAVAALNGSGTTRAFAASDEEGNWSVVVPAGVFRITAWDPEMHFVPMFHPAGATFATAAPVSVAGGGVAGPVVLAMPAAGRVVGRVTSADSAAPLPGAVVVLYALDGTLVHETLAGADGRYVTGAVSGTYKIVAFDRAGYFVKLFHGDGTRFDDAAALSLVGGGPDVEIDFALRAARRRGVRRSGEVPAAGDAGSRFDRTAAPSDEGVLRPPGELRER